MSKEVKIIDKNAGTKIEYRQSGTKMYFGDDDIMINASKYQKDWPVLVDVCRDRAGNLTIGSESANKYVAQVEIPEIEYSEIVSVEETIVEAQPIDMSEVTLILWSID